MIAPPIRWPEKLGRSLLEIVYPRRCLCCGDPLLFRASLRLPICGRCEQALSPIEAQNRCVVCSIPLISELERCTRCSERLFSFTCNFSLYEYRGPIRQIISQFKFSNRRSLAGLIAGLLYPELERRYPDLPVIPVPGSRRSVRRRGWDPMLEVARALRRSRGTEILTPLMRTRGAAQKGLHYRERMENIRGTIQLNRGSRCGAGLRRPVVLLDDIFTSGATADECTRILRLAGVREVFVLTLAMEL
jgi:ComF family protein